MPITPTHLKHKPIVSIEDYTLHDGIQNTDAKHLTVGLAQYNRNEISAKVLRKVKNKWSRQSEELPLHRVVDLATVILMSILKSAKITYQTLPSNMDIDIITQANLHEIVDSYKNNKTNLLPKLKELQTMLDLFMQEEPNL